MPRLYAGVELEHFVLEAVLEENRARHVDRQVEQEIAFAEQGREDLADVVARNGIDDEPDAVVLGFLSAGLVRGEYGDALWRHVDMPQDQRQSALPDGT